MHVIKSAATIVESLDANDINMTIINNPTINTIKNLAQRRRLLLEHLYLDRGLLFHTNNPINLESLKRTITFVKKELEIINEAIFTIIQQDKTFARYYEILSSIPFLTHHIILTLLSELPEIGIYNSGQLSVRAGVAPTNQRGPNHRRQARRALHLAILYGLRKSHWVKQRYTVLIENGKSHPVAIQACMNKLLIRLTRLIHKDLLWDPERA